ncbi:hypothetical protein AALB51_07520 [Lachnospiraceae bacterium 62-26]|jgi:hypothetical protein
MEVKNEKELGQAIKNNVELIEVEFDLKRKVLRIRSVGKVAWGICIASIAVAVTSLLATMATGGTLAPASAFVATPALAGAVGILGGSTTVTAVGIAVAGGGVASLNKLRQYKVKKISKDKIQLIKK